MRKVIFFDGVCHLCNGFVDAIIKRDSSHLYAFAPLQGSTATSLLDAKDRTNLDTVIYFEAGKIYYRSSAILKILMGLGGPHRLWALAWIIPRPLRDILYRFIAYYRYKWFGQREFCRLPAESEKAYLLP